MERELTLRFKGEIYEIGFTIESDEYFPGTCPVCEKECVGNIEEDYDSGSDFVWSHSLKVKEILEKGVVPIKENDPIFQKLSRKLGRMIPLRMCSACYQTMRFDDEKGVVFEEEWMGEFIEEEMSKGLIPDNDFY